MELFRKIPLRLLKGSRGLFLFLSLVLILPIISRLLTYPEFGEEGEKLAAGKLMLQGAVLYKDVFSHHFPLAYFVAAAGSVFGASIIAARVCMLSVWISCFAIVALAPGLAPSTALAAVAWFVFGPFYLSQTLLYNSVAAATIFVCFGITLASLTFRRVTKQHALVVGAFAALSVLADPLQVYPVAIVIAFWLLDRSMRLRFPALIMGGFLVGAVFLGYLLLTDSFIDFISQAIGFNLEYYPRSNSGELQVPLKIWQELRSFLTVLNWDWINLPLLPKTFWMKGWEADFDYTILGGVAARIIVLVFILWNLLRCEFRVASFVLLFFVFMTGSEHDRGLAAQSFFVCALLCGAVLGNTSSKPTSHLSRTVKVLGCSYLVALTVVCASHHYLSWDKFGIERNYREVMQRARFYRKLVPDTHQVKLAVYPFDPYSFYFSDFEPLAGFTFMWPWVARYGMSKVIDALQN
ncbi:MAG: hypothetical protein KDD42_03705, partial [Bdellovibrionales bacterium]|nr:hypothetical protein [Bdellovibrionales bacterium]